MKKKVLIVAAHPDDEVLGCGATAAKLVEEGNDVYTLILGGCTTSGKGDRGAGLSDKKLGELKDQIYRANNIIGVKGVFTHDLADNRFDKVALLDIVKIIEKYITEIKPHIVYTHFSGDLNIDHGITSRAVVTAARPVPGCSVEAVYFFEVPSSTEWQSSDEDVFRPNHFVDVSASMEKKISALKEYASEIKEFPHPRSVKGIKTLAEYRGSTVGKVACEAFVVERSIQA